MADAAKTGPTTASVDGFLAAVADPGRRADAAAVCAMMREVTGHPPVMWGTAIVGFGQHRYVYDSGRSGEWFVVGLSPRKAALTLYLGTVEGPGRAELLGRLGKHSLGKGCLYVKRLADVDQGVLRALITAAVLDMRARYGATR